MIIAGRVHTVDGPVDIRELKAGDRVIDFGHRPRVVTAVRRQAVDGAVAFVRNRGLLVSRDTGVYTLYGKRAAQAGPVQVLLPTGGSANDEATEEAGSYQGYVVEFEDMDGIWVENYCVGV